MLTRKLFRQKLRINLPTIVACGMMLFVSIVTFLYSRRLIYLDRVALVQGETLAIREHLDHAVADVTQSMDGVKEQLSSETGGQDGAESHLPSQILRQYYSLTGIKRPTDRQFQRAQEVELLQQGYLNGYLETAVVQSGDPLFLFVADSSSGKIEFSSIAPRLKSWQVTNINQLINSVCPPALGANRVVISQMADSSQLYRILNADKTPQDDHLDVSATRAATRYMIIAEPVGSGIDQDKCIVGIVSWSLFDSALKGAREFFKVPGFGSGYAYLLSADGNTLLEHDSPAWIGKKLDEDFDLRNVEDTALRTKGNEPLTVEYDLIDPSKIGRQTVAECHKFFSGCPESVHKFASVVRFEPPVLSKLTWFVAVGLNDEDAFAILRKLEVLFMLSTLLAIVCMVAINRLMQRSMRLSILHFSDMAREVAEGKRQIAADTADVDEVQDAFNQMLLLVKTKADFVPMSNPYVAGNPIRSREMFFGRDGDLRWVTSALLSQSNVMIGIYGPRRIGKSSLLRFIESSGFDPRFATVFVDTQEMVPRIKDDSGFYSFLEDALYKRVGSRPSTAAAARLPH